MSVFFTSDLHFGHRLVAGHRGFGTDTEAHDQAIAENWRRVVRLGDQVWVLGDLALAHYQHPLTILADLPGQKHLIAGNHDACHPMHREAHKVQRHYMGIFASVQAFARRKIAGETVLLSHFPYVKDRHEARYMQYRLRDEGEWLIHGHTHGPEQREGREIHVGLDAWGLQLVPIHTIERLMKEDQ